MVSCRSVNLKVSWLVASIAGRRLLQSLRGALIHVAGEKHRRGEEKGRTGLRVELHWSYIAGKPEMAMTLLLPQLTFWILEELRLSISSGWTVRFVWPKPSTPLFLIIIPFPQENSCPASLMTIV